MRRNILAGTSSYYNRLWAGIFYPEELPSAKWFEYYASRFATFEINATFYRFPGVKSLKTWYNKTPEGFVFSVKAPKQITHLNRFAESEELIRKFYSVCTEGLGDKLGNILFQLPPSFGYTEENLALVTANLDPAYNNVIEFRNAGWWQDEVYAALGERGITFCNVNYPGLPTRPVLTSKIAYFRLHGNPGLFYSEYSEEALLQVYQWLSNRADWEEAYIYFNNTASAGGIRNAMQFLSMTDDGSYYNLPGSREPKEPPDI